MMLLPEVKCVCGCLPYVVRTYDTILRFAAFSTSVDNTIECSMCRVVESHMIECMCRVLESLFNFSRHRPKVTKVKGLLPQLQNMFELEHKIRLFE
jgi:hypothetical protein